MESLLPRSPDTVAELRALYRAAEARAARLRLLVELGRDLAAATGGSLDETLAASARRIALFVGSRDGTIRRDTASGGIALAGPGQEAQKFGVLELSDGRGLLDVADPEDREALEMLTHLLAEAIARVERDAERDALLAAVEERERRLEAMVGQLFSAQEEERRRVSRELHDGVAQTATALFRRLEGHGDGDSAAIARGLVHELRVVIGGLRPTTLDDLGLRAAIGAQAEALRTLGYRVRFTARGPERWPTVLETAFFRVAQEAIANAGKHAVSGCTVQVILCGDPARRRWNLAVGDRGGATGIAARPVGAIDGEHVGLAMMHERMAAIGGTLEVRARVGGGLLVRARVVGGPA